MRTWSFAKGHGTQNDFVILRDRHDMLAPTAADVRFLCHRRVGIGGDGLLRAVKAGHVAGHDAEADLWFMDYRNADGSVAEMCGNGIRVFARFLAEEGLLGGSSARIATRAGVKEVELLGTDQVRVAMSPVRVTASSVVEHQRRRFAATGVDVGNPHAVCRVGDAGSDAGDTRLGLDTLDLTTAPRHDTTTYPHGVNVEFVEQVADHHIAMRVFERGVGETMSCGTGTVAAATAARVWAGEQGDATWRVDVLGGTVEIAFDQDTVWMTGPAVIVARGEVHMPD